MARPTKDRQIIKYLFISDLQIPDHERSLLPLLYKFIDDYIPDVVIIIGDFLNFTEVSSYTSPDYHVTLQDELSEGREILAEIVNRTRRETKKTRVVFLQGNHEQRLERYMATNARSLEGLTMDGEQLVSLSHLLEFRKLGIEYIPYKEAFTEIPDTIVIHGEVARKNSAYTAKANFESYGKSVICGHTHRAGMYLKTYGDKTYTSIEIGCLCNLRPTPRYMGNTDWQHSFMIGYVDQELNQFYPQLIPIYNNSFQFGGKIYR